MTILAIKIDVDTEIGTRIGIPNLLVLLKGLQIPATFYLSLGSDNTGRAIKRIFRKGFFKKCARTSVISTHGLRTLLNGVLLPGPHIGKKHEQLLRTIKGQGFDVGVHAYDHQKWQDGVTQMSQERITEEFKKALNEFQRIFGTSATTAAAPGWQANEKTLAVYDQASFIYASDCRGASPFFPKISDKTYKTLQIPTTLPTLDELLGRSEFPLEKLTAHYLSLLKPDALNVLTIHTELEGMKYLAWFRSFLVELKKQNIQFTNLSDIAKSAKFPVCELVQAGVEGRSGKLAWQGKTTVIV
ncbi:undecaprenyl phosphate-alpha-L-ara4FN deformylase [Gammaproteobacteria bacterium]